VRLRVSNDRFALEIHNQTETPFAAISKCELKTMGHVFSKTKQEFGEIKAKREGEVASL
jgi:hypothetical protein